MKFLFLGLLQGLTEFLPISSSGHLVVFQKLTGVGENLALDTVLHLATTLALIAYFWRDLIDLITNKDKRRILWFVGVSFAMTGVIGLLFKDFFESLFSSVLLAGVFLIINGLVLLLGEYLGKRQRKLTEMNLMDSLMIGLSQAIAIIPAISRSGTTMAAGLARNFERGEAARFSFILAIPTILAAGLLQAKTIVKAGAIGIGAGPLIWGFLAAFISGWLTIKFFLALVQKVSLNIFAYYCFVLGLVVILFIQ